MDISFLERYGFCLGCKQWLPIFPDKDCLPHHEGKNRTKCPDSGYSYWNLRYKCPDQEAALKLAKLIANDDGKCLDNYRGRHSLACGDGDNCEAMRLRLAKALADYVLNQ